MVLEKSFIFGYPASDLFLACCEVIRSIPKQEFNIVSPELHTIHSLLHDYPSIQNKESKLLWKKESTVSIFIQVSSINSQSSKLDVSMESFLVPLGPSIYTSASCQYTLAYFLDSLMHVLKGKS